MVVEAEQAKSKHSDARTCPQCGKASVHRSRRGNWSDYILALARMYPYRCHECNFRYHVRRKNPRTILWAQCPKCLATNVQRIAKDKVQLNSANFLLRLVLAPAYRCPRCRTRFFDLRPRKRVPAEF